MTGGSILGRAVTRREDPRLIRGAGAYVGDMTPAGVLHAVFARSDLPHGRVRSVEVEAARSADGVVAVLTAHELDLAPLQIWGAPPECARPPLAATVRYVGDPYAVVIAESERIAADAAGLIYAEIDELPATVDPIAAMAADAPILFEDLGSNIALEERSGFDGDALAGSEVVVEHRLVNQRLAPVPLEGSGCLATVDADGRLTVWLSTQDVFNTRTSLAAMLRIDSDQLRIIAPDVGGGFGAKGDLLVEHAVVAESARRLGRPVRWVERRTENFINMVHGRAQVQRIRLGATQEGRLRGFQLDVVADLGAYPGVATWLPRYTLEMACGCYDIPRAAASFRSVVTNTTPTGPYRGAGRPEAIQAIERAMDLLALELGMDPVELRRLNLQPPFTDPVTTAIGTEYDSGDYGSALDLALDRSSHRAWIAERDARRAHGDRLQLGVGVGCYVEVTVGKTPLHELGSVEVARDGTIVARAGGANHGQGHATAFAQIVADRFEIPLDRVTVVQGDTDQVPRGGGTYASRTVQLAGSSLFVASNAVVDRARELAADLLEAAVADITVVPGVGLGVAGAPHTAIAWGDLAQAATEKDSSPLAAEVEHPQGAATYPFGTHVAVVEVDTETGWVRLVEHTAVDDCGTVINPMLVKGQQHGGVAQGAGQALFEHARFGSEGQPLTTNLISYFVPAATDLPNLRTISHVTPTPHNPLGAKGVGEAGTLGSTPAIHSAVIDALRPFGVRHLDLPLRPERVWRAIHNRPDESERP